MLLVKAPEKLKPEEKVILQRVLQANVSVQRAYHFGQAFFRLVRQRFDKALTPWLTVALDSGISELRQFAKGLVQDQAAVQAALSLPWSSGQVEGQVNRLKFIKRQMYGRAKFNLGNSKKIKRQSSWCVVRGAWQNHITHHVPRITSLKNLNLGTALLVLQEEDCHLFPLFFQSMLAKLLEDGFC